MYKLSFLKIIFPKCKCLRKEVYTNCLTVLVQYLTGKYAIPGIAHKPEEW